MEFGMSLRGQERRGRCSLFPYLFSEWWALWMWGFALLWMQSCELVWSYNLKLHLSVFIFSLEIFFMASHDNYLCLEYVLRKQLRCTSQRSCWSKSLWTPCASGRTWEAELSHAVLIVWVSSDIKTGVYVKLWLQICKAFAPWWCLKSLIPEAGHVITCFAIQADDCRFRAENTGKTKELK